MLLKTYSLEIFKSKCQADAEGVHCFAHLDQNVTEAIPYLNAVLGGYEYLNDPPAVTFKSHGKLITVHGDKIAVNALKDDAEGAKGPDDCPPLDAEQYRRLTEYMGRFNLEI